MDSITETHLVNSQPFLNLLLRVSCWPGHRFIAMFIFLISLQEPAALWIKPKACCDLCLDLAINPLPGIIVSRALLTPSGGATFNPMSCKVKGDFNDTFNRGLILTVGALNLGKVEKSEIDLDDGSMFKLTELNEFASPLLLLAMIHLHSLRGKFLVDKSLKLKLFAPVSNFISDSQHVFV